MAQTQCLLRTVLWRPQYINNPLDISLELPSKATDHNGSDETAELNEAQWNHSQMLGWHSNLHKHFSGGLGMFRVTLHLKHCVFKPNGFSENEEVLRVPLGKHSGLVCAQRTGSSGGEGKIDEKSEAKATSGTFLVVEQL